MQKILLTVAALVFVSPLLAEVRANLDSDSDAQCAALVQECFGRENSERANCLYTASTHPFCEGTELGKLTYKRWEISPIRFAGQEEPPALLGPQFVDLECVANFDNRIYGLMVDNNLNTKQIAQLSKDLDSCKRKTPMELPRP